jgi:hypothetical protein
MSFYKVFAELGIVKHDLFNKYEQFVNSGVWDTVLFQGVAIGCRRPQKVCRDEQHRLSNDQGPAIRWRDGFELFCLDGVHLTKIQHKDISSKTMSFREIMAIENADVRAVALKYNPEAILSAGAELIDKSERGNELYLIEKTELNKFLEEPEIYFLKMTCPTGRIFVEGSPPDIARKHPSADYLQAYALGINLGQYKNLVNEG